MEMCIRDRGGDDGAAGLGAYLKFIQNLVAVLVKHQAPYAGRPGPVSYTHLDVYKRQGLNAR